jgi:hypothetical protein
MRRPEQSIFAGVLVGGGLWALFITSVVGTEDLPQDIFLFLFVSLLLFLVTTAALSLVLFYLTPTLFVSITQKYMAAKESDSMRVNVKDHHTSQELRYRFSTGLIFAFAATIAMPVFFSVIAFFSRRGGHSAEMILESLSFSAKFSIAAFMWGVLFTSRFRVSKEKKPLSSIIICFLWGCVITALTMFTTGFYLRLIESIKHMELSMKAIEYGYFIWGFGSVFTFGILYVVGGAAGVIAGIRYRRIVR